ncbi:MAG: hypothetical protein R2851_05045 [Caldilineaceae bacterium]
MEAIFPASDNPMFYPDMADEGYKPHKISHLYVRSRRTHGGGGHYRRS